MLNEILNAAVSGMRDLFGEAIAIYTGIPAEEPQRPYLTAGFSEISEKQMAGGRRFRKGELHIRYMADMASQEGVFNAYEAMDLLLDGLRMLTFEDGSRIHGSGLNCKITDGVMEIFTTYQLLLTDQTEPEDNSMEQISIGGGQPSINERKGEQLC